MVNHRQLVAWLTQSPYPYTTDQITAIGDHINKMQDEDKDRAAGAYKAEAIEGVRNAGEAELLMLKKGYFSLFIRLMVEEEMPLTEMRAKVIRTKTQENALLLADQVRILFSEVPDEILWRQTQENVLQAMVANPVNVQAVLHLTQTMMGWESSVRHAQVREGVFAAEITITRGERSYASGRHEGHGKTDAEIKAFVGLLQTMTSIHVEIPEGKKVPTDSGNHKGQLMEMCQQNRWSFPTFDHSQTGPSNQPLFTCVAELERQDEEKLVTEPCKAPTKKAAERMASKAMLTLLGVKDHDRPDSAVGDKAVAGAVPTDWRSNPISALQEYCQKKGYNLPEYSDQRSGQDHTPSFTMTCVVMIDGSEQSFQADGSNKKEAKRNAAAKACEKVFAKAA